MRKARPYLVLLAIVAGLLAVLLRQGYEGQAWDNERGGGYTVYSGSKAGCAIIVPQEPTRDELAAAQLLSDTLAKAAGRNHFPVQCEAWWRFWQRGIKVGHTKKAGLLWLPGTSRLERLVGAAVSPDGVILRSRWPEDVTVAAGWFLEKNLGAHWFIPGPLGVAVAPRESLRLAFGAETAAPSFVSRNLGGLGSPDDLGWYGANRLQGVITHGHSMSEIFKPQDVTRMPELAPLLNWQKYFPTRPNEQEWQPNLAAKSAAPHAVAVLRRKFTDAPGQVAVSLAMNDSIRYDQSKETLLAVGEPRWFRHKPDYSDLVFGFANQVARGLQTDFPDRLVSTYAYDWTENVPRFPVEPNVVPYLTADRSQWFDPAFAAEDQDLMKRWVAAGPKVVGIYDYYEGAPFLVPRPTIYAVARAIPFAHQAGVRAFYAEGSPNWGIDGPKYWLAAQLLWNVKQDPAALLDTYYREYWQEAAGPMREFFELCDRQWLEQPLPSYWLKYFKDEHQALVFPPEARRELRTKLEAARGLVRQDVVRARLELTSAAFAVTEAFCEFNEARDRLSRLALAVKLNGEAVSSAAQTMQAARSKLEKLIIRTEASQPLALSAKLIEEYTRNDPRRRALWRLLKQGDAPLLSADNPGFVLSSRPLPRGETEAKRTEVRDQNTEARFIAAFGDLMAGGSPPALNSKPKELAIDGSLMRLALRNVADFTALDWVKSGYWRGHGEPYETRRVSVERPETGNLKPEIGSSSPQVSGLSPQVWLRFAGCKQETLSQWHPAAAGAWYAATARVRARVSPGNMTFLIVTFLDEKGKYLGIGSIDRLPVGDWNEAVELAVLVKAPKEAKQVGIGVRVLNQVNDDFAEFAELSLREMR